MADIQSSNRHTAQKPGRNKETTAQENPIFLEEAAHLEDVKGKLGQAVSKANASVQQIDKEYMDAKRYMAENRGEIDPHEMFQNKLALRQIDNRGVITVENRQRLAKLLDSPYFSRIDFREASGGTEVPYYIGRFAFNHETELLITDWRSPVASMFYDYEVGPAGYNAPQGRIDGDLTRKRQFKIKNGEMEYALESSVNIQDDILQMELSHTSDEKMKTIISTIQKEQNVIIRNEQASTILLQGVAGSGKTSIALHRIAYLLYRFKDRLSAKNMTILSPNKVFGDYISNVLPEFGEEPIYEMSFADIAQVQLEKVIHFEDDRDPFEANDPKWAERVRFKSTMDFLKLMDEYLEGMPRWVFEPADYTFEGFFAKSDWILSRYLAYENYPVKRRLQMVADDILDRFETDNHMGDPLPKIKNIFKVLKEMLRVKNTLSLYTDFFRQKNVGDKLMLAGKNTLEWNDVYPFLYFHAAFEGLKEGTITRHLVIDEMQDYTPTQYAVMNILFRCQKTILGDFGQFVNPNHLNTLKDLRQLYEGAQFVELNKSYRSSYEIITFAKRIQRVASLEAMERHGEVPQIIPCTDAGDEVAKIAKLIDRFQKSEYVNLGIILKTNREAKKFYELLNQNYPVHLITPESSSFVNGISITSIQMSKGLEFDEVIVPGVNRETYFNEYDRCLLYIACTRAMHRLTLTHTGVQTELISET